MIDNERQCQSARSWIAYWKESKRDGEESWLSNENAGEEIMRHSRNIDEYQKRTAVVHDGAA